MSGLCTHVNFGMNAERVEGQRSQTANTFSLNTADSSSRGGRERGGGSFFTSVNHNTHIMVYIFIFIYLKCIMVQKYRRSAAPRYIYKINTPSRQNKLLQNIDVKKGKSEDSHSSSVRSCSAVCSDIFRIFTHNKYFPTSFQTNHFTEDVNVSI